MNLLQGHLTCPDEIYSEYLHFSHWNLLQPIPGKASPNEAVQITLFSMLDLPLMQCFPLKEKLFGPGHNHEALWDKPMFYSSQNEFARQNMQWQWHMVVPFLCSFTDFLMNPHCGQTDPPLKLNCCHLAPKVFIKH